MDVFSFIFGSLAMAVVAGVVAAALGAGTAVVWIAAICALLAFGVAAMKYDT
jgi:hypothetical protein